MVFVDRSTVHTLLLWQLNNLIKASMHFLMAEWLMFVCRSQPVVNVCQWLSFKVFNEKKINITIWHLASEELLSIARRLRYTDSSAPVDLHYTPIDTNGEYVWNISHLYNTSCFLNLKSSDYHFTPRCWSETQLQEIID